MWRWLGCWCWCVFWVGVCRMVLGGWCYFCVSVVLGIWLFFCVFRLGCGYGFCGWWCSACTRALVYRPSHNCVVVFWGLWLLGGYICIVWLCLRFGFFFWLVRRCVWVLLWLGKFWFELVFWGNVWVPCRVRHTPYRVFRRCKVVRRDLVSAWCRWWTCCSGSCVFRNPWWPCVWRRWCRGPFSISCFLGIWWALCLLARWFCYSCFWRRCSVHEDRVFFCCFCCFFVWSSWVIVWFLSFVTCRVVCWFGVRFVYVL